MNPPNGLFKVLLVNSLKLPHTALARLRPPYIEQVCKTFSTRIFNDLEDWKCNKHGSITAYLFLKERQMAYTDEYKFILAVY